ncbi:MAG: transcriptional repressor LexA [Nitrospirales bacterium]|nr:transcriptional repressor LexA [Nitrospirales bacterium]
MRSLTEKQKRVLDFLISFTEKNGFPPTVREIGEHFGFLWSAARTHLKALERKGVIRLNRARSRGIEIPGLRPAQALRVPVAGRIRAGNPVLALEEIGDQIVVDRSLFSTEGAFSLRIVGDSMVDAGILDGDYVIVRPQESLENGEIGVVLLGDEATVKRVFFEEGAVVLRPENRHMPIMKYPPDEVRMAGKVIGVIRKI